jgi:hypothetical protein
MKSYRLFILSFFLESYIITSAQESSLFAVVNENNVTIWETSVRRDCGASYVMGIDLDSNNMTWWQHDDGVFVTCLCYFDLAVYYGPLEPGDYNVDVYYTSAEIPGVTYDGSTTFTIQGSRETSDSIVSGYQSECGGVGINENRTEKIITVDLYPNPVCLGKILHINALNIHGEAILELFSSDGQIIYSRKFQDISYRGEILINSDIFRSRGIYFARLQTSQNAFIRKIVVR